MAAKSMHTLPATSEDTDLPFRGAAAGGLVIEVESVVLFISYSNITQKYQKMINFATMKFSSFILFSAAILATGCSHDRKYPSPSEWDLAVAEWEKGAEIEIETSKEGVNAEIEPAKRDQRVWTQPVGRYNEIFNDSNYIQYRSAERLGIRPMHTLADAYHTRRPLVRIKSGENFRVDSLTHSMPFLVPEAAQLLNEIGSDFCDLVEERGGDRSNKIIVTSVLRSPQSVKKLRRVNRNAVDSSTHMFATTFDISWAHFDCPDSTKSVDPTVLKGILAEVLLQKRNEGKCYIKYEQKSPCFHITVNK